MPGAEQIKQTVNRYLELVAKGSADDLTAMYAENATVEDPVGSDVRHGRDAIREFYKVVENIDAVTELDAVRVAGNEAAFLWRLIAKVGDRPMKTEPISVMAFDDDGRIAAMRAYWSPENVTQLL
jgi:steroid delta-isomerase